MFCDGLIYRSISPLWRLRAARAERPILSSCVRRVWSWSHWSVILNWYAQRYSLIDDNWSCCLYPCVKVWQTQKNTVLQGPALGWLVGCNFSPSLVSDWLPLPHTTCHCLWCCRRRGNYRQTGTVSKFPKKRVTSYTSWLELLTAHLYQLKVICHSSTKWNIYIYDDEITIRIWNIQHVSYWSKQRQARISTLH